MPEWVPAQPRHRPKKNTRPLLECRQLLGRGQPKIFPSSFAKGAEVSVFGEQQALPHPSRPGLRSGLSSGSGFLPIDTPTQPSDREVPYTHDPRPQLDIGDTVCSDPVLAAARAQS